MYSIPNFNYDDDINDYFREIEKIKSENNKENYKCIMEFINVWLNIYNLKIDALLKFKNIPIDKITSKPDENKRLYKKFAPILSKKFKINIHEKIIEQSDEEEVLDIDTDELEDDILVSFISKLLKKIDYKIIINKSNTKSCYSIVKK
jgi:hypothetical protein